MNRGLIDTKNKARWRFLLMLALFAIPCVLRYFTGEMNAQNTTVFAFSYKYGFISRGLMGTVWKVLDKILPFDLMNFDSIQMFSGIATIVFFIVLFAFYNTCLKLCEDKNYRRIEYLICFLSVFIFPMFVTLECFGRLDIYLMILTLICCILLVKDKWEWMIIPIVTICVIMHHGYVFMHLNIVLVLLFYKILMNAEKRKKYITIFAFTFIIASILFLYFEFFSHPEGEGIFDEIVSLSMALSMDGASYSESMVFHEILGLDIYDLEEMCHVMNRKETPFFMLFFCIYPIIGLHFLIKLFKGKTTVEKWAYFAVGVGSLTILPQVILKVDFGRYVFATFFYYITIVICLIVMKDKNVIKQLEDTIEVVKNKIPAAKLLIVYPMMFMPFLDVHISYISYRLYTLLGI